MVASRLLLAPINSLPWTWTRLSGSEIVQKSLFVDLENTISLKKPVLATTNSVQTRTRLSGSVTWAA